MSKSHRQSTSKSAYPALTQENVVRFPQQAARTPSRARTGVSLTKAAVKRLTLPAGKSDAVFWDRDLAGFGLRLKGDKRSWVVQFRKDGVSRRQTIGSTALFDPDEARRRARKLLADKPDPSEARRKAQAAVKLGDLVDGYLAYAGDRQKPSTHGDTTRNLRTHAKPLHGLALRDIDRATVSRLHERLTAKSGPVQANRVLASLSSFFGWAIGKGHVDLNPVLGVPKNAEKPKERVLSDPELKAIWQASGEGDFGTIVKLLMLTGVRRQEIGDMAWSELSTADGQTLWTIPGSRTKNHLPHELPLPDAVATLLPRRPDDGSGEGSRYIFGKLPHSGYSGWSKATARLQRKVGFADFTLHDLRRTFSTKLHDELGIEPHVVEALLNHISGHRAGPAGTYNRASYRAAKTAALERWVVHVAGIVDS